MMIISYACNFEAIMKPDCDLAGKSIKIKLSSPDVIWQQCLYCICIMTFHRHRTPYIIIVIIIMVIFMCHLFR